MVSPSARRRAAQYLVEGQKCSVNRACEALHLAKSTFYRQGLARRSSGRLEKRIKALSRRHPTYGYRFITQLRREGSRVNRKRVQRVRRKEELQVVRKARKTKRLLGRHGARMRAARPNEVWSYDFIHDRLENGAGLKMLTVLDEYTRECLGILVERSITATGVVGFLELLMLQNSSNLDRPRWLKNVNLTNLVIEARSLAELGQRNGEWYWTGNSTNLPTTIRSFASQKVVLRTNPAPLRVEISMRSGFFHHGLLIVCESNAAVAIPRVGRDWRVTKLSDFVYEYKE